MYHTQKNPLKKVLGGKGEAVHVVRQTRTRRLHKAFLRYHDPENWPTLREALKEMGRADLIGNSKKHLIPLFQPAGTGRRPEGARILRDVPVKGEPRTGPATRGRPPQVPKHPLSQRRGGGKSRP